ncbi:TerD family protein [Streptomyces xanthophaeus]|uniref:TerD family protein n=1 Tax=Streptomyces xanthophaeus TaxID=67385 RepID=UPI0026497875|nr:TerD family protein [Streptomyces xanthophaeus]WKD36231.1 TerD family protein [Streptomyces xanthophaeus]
MTLASTVLNAADPNGYAFPWALVDVETSGLIPRRDRVLSIAVVTLGPDGQQTGEFTTLLNPGCDPGPVHVHGLTAEVLSDAPTFDQVADRIGAMLQDRIMVAHNAQFDYDFLAHEFARARSHLPVSRRLCTLALNRRVDPPTADLRLGTLAAHYGVAQKKAHDALDDTHVLAGILRASLREAARLDLSLPLVSCPPRQDPRFTPKPPKTPCAFRNPGRLAPGGALGQGMKIVITGDTDTARAELVAQAVAAGLNVMGSVSRFTSVLVTNDPVSTSAKARRALDEGVPLLDERTFLKLLGDVRPGTSPDGGSPGADLVVSPAPPPAEVAPDVPTPRHDGAASQGRLAGRRVLVLGGLHQDAADARARVVALGGAAAVNLSASVTDAVLLAGGERDRRMARITSLQLPVHQPEWLTASTAGAPPAHTREVAPSPRVLPRGGVVDLPSAGSPTAQWNVSATWAQQTGCEIDVVAFTVDSDEQVSRDEDFVFYGAPESPDGAVRLLSDGPTEQTIVVDLASMPPAARKVVVVAAIDGGTAFGDIGPVHITLAAGADTTRLAQSTLDAATTERTLILAELYRRGPLWRFRAVGQGYDRDLAAVARSYGVDIAE